eukprot:Clim_evm11s29 gene=Clim_evmTU11s29
MTKNTIAWTLSLAMVLSTAAQEDTSESGTTTTTTFPSPSTSESPLDGNGSNSGSDAQNRGLLVAVVILTILLINALVVIGVLVYRKHRSDRKDQSHGKLRDVEEAAIFSSSSPNSQWRWAPAPPAVASQSCNATNSPSGAPLRSTVATASGSGAISLSDTQKSGRPLPQIPAYRPPTLPSKIQDTAAAGTGSRASVNNGDAVIKFSSAEAEYVNCNESEDGAGEYFEVPAPTKVQLASLRTTASVSSLRNTSSSNTESYRGPSADYLAAVAE